MASLEHMVKQGIRMRQTSGGGHENITEIDSIKMQNKKHKAYVPPTSVSHTFNKQKITTKEFAAALSIQQQSIRSALCRAGHYLGLVPVKLPNGRMLWDAQSVHLLLNQGCS